jgi:hypothetical protein
MTPVGVIDERPTENAAGDRAIRRRRSPFVDAFEVVDAVEAMNSSRQPSLAVDIEGPGITSWNERQHRSFSFQQPWRRSRSTRSPSTTRSARCGFESSTATSSGEELSNSIVCRINGCQLQTLLDVMQFLCDLFTVILPGTVKTLRLPGKGA